MYDNLLLMPKCPKCSSPKVNAYFISDGSELSCQCNEKECGTKWLQKPVPASAINDTKRLDYIEGQLLRRSNFDMNGTYYLSIKALGKVPMGKSFRELIDDRIYKLDQDVRIVWSRENEEKEV
jgi:hypothetical protein